MCCYLVGALGAGIIAGGMVGVVPGEGGEKIGEEILFDGERDGCCVGKRSNGFVI